MKKKLATLMAAILAIALLMTACVSSVPSAGQLEETNKAVGTILLSVNPEIEIEYDSKGTVINIRGRNEDGKAIAAQYTDYLGQPCDTVVTELVKKIYAAGYFEVEVDGKAKNIVIKLEEGSAYPDDSFLEKVAASVRSAVNTQGGKSDTMVVGKEDLNKNGLIGLEKAKELVLAQLDLTEAEFTDKEYELDDGVYELEFTAGGIEYEYEVDGRTGKILKVDTEPVDGPVPPSDPTAPVTTLSLEDAKALVFSYLGITQAQVYDLDAEYDDGRFEIDFDYNGAEYEFDVDAKTGEILKIEKDDIPQNATTPPTQPEANLTVEDVKALVFGYLGITEGQVYDLDVDHDNGRFEIDFDYNGAEYEFDVDAKTGQILKIEKNDIRQDVSTHPTQPTEPVQKLTLAEAKALVFAQLGITEAQAYDLDAEYDDGRFEISFDHNGYEYEFEVDPATGTVTQTDKEPVDD